MKSCPDIAKRIREGVTARGFYFLLDQEIPNSPASQEQELHDSLDALARRNGWRMIDVRNCSAHLFLPS